MEEGEVPGRRRGGGRERYITADGRPSCQIVVDLFLFNLLTPRVTLHLSHRFSFSIPGATLGRATEVGSRVKNRCRKDRGGGLVEGETDRLGKGSV